MICSAGISPGGNPAETTSSPGTVAGNCLDFNGKPATGSRLANLAQDQRAQARGRAIRCASCAHRITSTDAATRRAGAHRHTFANPAGLVFVILLFGSAPGATPLGREHTEFTWFPDHTWQVLLCGSCHRHLGWRFRGPHGLFAGLVDDRIVMGSSHGDH